MPYCISEVRHKEYPDSSAVASALSRIGLTLDELLGAFRAYICPIAPSSGRGYATDLADDLTGYLERLLPRDGLRGTRNRQQLMYSRALHQHADFGLIHDQSHQTVYFEMAFRPDFERDLLKFQIGASEGSLAAGVLVLSIDPRSLDATATTMSSYETVSRVLEVLRPGYPLVLIGLRGSHAA